MNNRIVQSISNLFHPLLSLTWATLLLVNFTPLVMLPTVTRWFLVGEVFFYSCMLPSLIFSLLSKIGIVKNGVALRDRKDRVFPLFIYMMLCYVQLRVLSVQGLPDWAMSCYLGGAFLSTIFAVVTIWWKISGHAAGNASVAVASLYLYYLFPTILPLWVPVVWIVLTGAVASIRVHLGRHTMAQVTAGMLAGALCIVVANAFL